MEEFRELQNKVERGEWLNLMPVRVERPAPNEEGLRKSEGLRKLEGKMFGAQQGDRGVGDGTVFKHGVDPQLQIIENLGSMPQAAHTENL